MSGAGGDGDGRAEVLARVERILREDLGVPVASPESDLLASGLLDSLTLVELLLALERELGASVPWDTLEIEAFTSVATIADFLLDGKEA